MGAGLEHETIDGKDYWFDAGAEPAPAGDGSAHLLPNFDEYTVAYRDRKAALHPDRPFEPAFFSFGSILSNVVIVGGRVRGAWRRTIVRRGVHVEIRSLDQFNKRERAAVDEAGRRLSRFLERPVEIAYLYPGH